MSMSEVSVSKFAMKKQVSSKDTDQKNERTRPVPEGYELLEKEGWSLEAISDPLIQVVGRNPGLKAGKIAEKVADIAGLSPEAREVLTVSRKNGKPNLNERRKKYKADTYHRLTQMKNSGLMKMSDNGGYTLVDSDSTQKLNELDQRVHNLEQMFIKLKSVFD